MIAVGDKIPDLKVRTDEGTPLNLSDLKGRSFVLFLLGETFSPTVERLLDVLAKKVSRFLTLDISPIAVLGDSVENLADYREQSNAPFLLFSDDEMALHRRLRGEDQNLAIAWIVDKEGTVADIMPYLPPTELISMTVDRASRTVFASSRKGS